MRSQATNHGYPGAPKQITSAEANMELTGSPTVHAGETPPITELGAQDSYSTESTTGALASAKRLNTVVMHICTV